MTGLLNRAGAVDCALCFKVSLMRFFRCLECTKVLSNAVKPDCCLPLASVVDNSKQPRGTIGPRSALVLHVLGVGYFTKIEKPVVAGVAVDVVDKLFRVCSMNIQPSQSSRLVLNIVDIDGGSSVLPTVSSNATGQRHATPNTPNKYAGFRVVMKQLFESLLGKDRMLFSHAVSPVKKWFGQRLACVDSTCEPRHFSAFHGAGAYQ